MTRTLLPTGSPRPSAMAHDARDPKHPRAVRVDETRAEAAAREALLEALSEHLRPPDMAISITRRRARPMTKSRPGMASLSDDAS